MLPLLLAGMGMLGGGQYLMKKQDEREYASLLDQYKAMPPLPGLQGQQIGAAFDYAAGRAGEGGILQNNRAEQMRSLLDSYTGMYSQLANQQIQQQQQQAQLSRQYGGDLYDAYNKNLQDFAVLQDTYRKGMEALQSNDAASSLAAAFNFFNLVEPGGIVRDEERQSFSGAGGASQYIPNLLNEIQGKGLSDPTRRALMKAMETQYRGRATRAESQRLYYQDRLNSLRSSGYDPASPEGSLGIDWRLSYDVPGQEQQQQQQLPPVPPGMTEEVPWWKQVMNNATNRN